MLILLFLCGACSGIRSGSSKKISSSNPTYLNINYENTSYYVDWQTDFQREKISLDREKKLQIKELIPLYIKTKLSRSMKSNSNKKSVPFFLLDTLNTNINGYYSYAENPVYFGKLDPIQAHYHRTKEDHTVGEYKEELLNVGFSYRDITFVLMQFGVIDTYDHLFSEMVIMKEVDTPDIHEVHYNCVYHICTNKCFDPKYKFLIRFDKNTRVITIGKI
ncbi:MAG: hypothetical protein ACI94Y_001530 [Maribacter sp.]|jgi:hypothetical protein